MAYGKPVHTAQQGAVRRLDGEPAGVITDQPISGEPPLQAVHRPVAEEPERVVLLGTDTEGRQIICPDRSQLHGGHLLTVTGHADPRRPLARSTTGQDRPFRCRLVPGRGATRTAPPTAQGDRSDPPCRCDNTRLRTGGCLRQRHAVVTSVALTY